MKVIGGKESSLRAQRSNLVPVALNPSRLLRRSAPRNDNKNYELSNFSSGN
jgi:hypothetical protein